MSKALELLNKINESTIEIRFKSTIDVGEEFGKRYFTFTIDDLVKSLIMLVKKETNEIVTPMDINIDSWRDALTRPDTPIDIRLRR